MHYELKRLGAEDFEDYHQIRIEGFEQQEREFRFSSQDEIKLPKNVVIERLKSDFIVGSYYDGHIVGIAGITRFVGSKLKHRALLWGMYVRPQYRGKNVANAIISSLINHSTDVGIESIVLTVVSSNLHAINFYKKWHFIPYAIDPYAVKLNNDDYLDEVLMVRRISKSS